MHAGESSRGGALALGHAVLEPPLAGWYASSPMSRPGRRILFVATYPDRAACTRFRASAFFPALRARGLEPELRPFLDDAFFAEFYRPGGQVSKALGLTAAALHRLRLLAKARRYGAVFVQREAALVGPALFEEACSRLGLPLIFDFDDAIWMADENATPGVVSKHPVASRLLKFPGKTERLIAMATEIVAGSEHLANFARERVGDQHVTVLPTVVSRALWEPLPGRLEGRILGEPPIIGWVGTHSSASQLDLVLPALRRLAAEGRRFKLRLVGAQRPEVKVAGAEVEGRPWTLARDVRDFQELDIGLAPMFNDPWCEGKCGFKQLQYMAVGVPQVSSLSGGGRDFLRHRENALIALNDDDWYRNIKALLDDHALRASLARAGRSLVEQQYCTEVQGERLADIIERAMVAGARRSRR